ncbi:hypothetical protein ElyMa_002075000 [Elysia marginata]|uniref:Uncharacterized protein n=1 Tax=Elysia marginata TaxID=1093978 RepID=A0AAV4FBA1_9GAST|nr:hypothetical protein ElyMa_002075000 [Elysia marginata]
MYIKTAPSIETQVAQWLRPARFVSLTSWWAGAWVRISASHQKVAQDPNRKHLSLSPSTQTIDFNILAFDRVKSLHFQLRDPSALTGLGLMK